MYMSLSFVKYFRKLNADGEVQPRMLLQLYLEKINVLWTDLKEQDSTSVKDKFGELQKDVL